MTDLFRWAGYGDSTTPFDHEATAFNPLFVYGVDGGEPCLVYTPAGSQTFMGKSPLGSPASISGRFAIKLSALPTGSVPIVAPLQSQANGGVSAWRLRVSSAGAIIIDNSSNTATGTSSPLTVGTWALVKYIATATTVKVRIYNAIRGGSLIGSEVVGTSTFGIADNWRQGQGQSSPIIPPYRLAHVLVTDGTGWVADPDVPATVSTPRYGIIGDSLTAMSGANGEFIRQALLTAGIPPQNVYLWGVGGKRITVADLTGKTSAQNIQDAKNVLTTIDHWIVALGTNDRPQTDATVNADIDTILSNIGATAKVTWIGLTSRGSASADDIRLNGLIQAKLTARGNATFADWNTHIRAIDGGANPSPYWLTTDTTHMTSLGYQERAAFYVNQIAAAPVVVDGTGVLTLTGSATRTVTVERSASGVLALSGTASRTFSVERTASGSLTLTGTAEPVITVTRSATGVLELSGTASTSGSTERTAEGILAITGTATPTVTIARTATGTLALTGAATPAVTIAREAEGSLALGGIGTYTFHVIRTALGILTLNGQGVITGEPVDWPARLTLTADVDTLTLEATVPTLTLETSW